MRNLTDYSLYLILLMWIVISACETDEGDDPQVEEASAQVEVTINNAQGSVLEGVKVYAFDQPVSDELVADPSQARASAITTNNGIAKFNKMTQVKAGSKLFFAVIQERLAGNKVLATKEVIIPEGEETVQETLAVPYWGYANGYLPTTIDNALALKEYNRWKNTQLRGCGDGLRIIAENQEETKVEAVGFGMLLAAYANDKTTFDGIHRFYNAKRTAQANNMMAWNVTCDGIIDPGSATDGDVDVAFALIVASTLWGDEYTDAAKEILEIVSSSVIKTCTVDGKEVKILGPGYSGIAWGGCGEMDIMYHTPAFFRIFAEVTGDNVWEELANDTYITLDAGAHPTTGLVPDWQTATGTPGPGTRVGHYGYDACRAPWKLTLDYLWNGNTQSQTWAKKIAAWAANKGPSNIVDGFELDGTPIGTNGLNSAFLGGFAVATMASNQGTVNLFGTELGKLNDTYWFNLNTRVLYLFTLTGNFWNPLEE